MGTEEKQVGFFIAVDIAQVFNFKAATMALAVGAVAKFEPCALLIIFSITGMASYLFLKSQVLVIKVASLTRSFCPLIQSKT